MYCIRRLNNLLNKNQFEKNMKKFGIRKENLMAKGQEAQLKIKFGKKNRQILKRKRDRIKINFQTRVNGKLNHLRRNVLGPSATPIMEVKSNPPKQKRSLGRYFLSGSFDLTGQKNRGDSLSRKKLFNSSLIGMHNSQEEARSIDRNRSRNIYSASQSLKKDSLFTRSFEKKYLLR